MNIKKISLAEWINEVGLKEVAAKIGVVESAVNHWRNGHCLPRHAQMQMIVHHSNGRVTYAEMIDTYFKQKKKGPRSKSSRNKEARP